jgi:AmiR/NasT family two-component response regulator
MAADERRRTFWHRLAVRRSVDGDQQELRNELEQLRRLRIALATRAAIGQAEGVIMASLGCSPDEAFAVLVKQSQTENVSLATVAAETVARVQRGPTTG